MVIGKDGLAANCKPPSFEIAEKRVRIPKAAECKKRASPDFIGGERSELSAQTAEPKQPSRRSENRILIEFPHRLQRSTRRFRPSKNNPIFPAPGPHPV